MLRFLFGFLLGSLAVVLTQHPAEVRAGFDRGVALVKPAASKVVDETKPTAARLARVAHSAIDRVVR